jgi:hypothetical protein
VYSAPPKTIAEKARNTRNVNADTLCSFEAEDAAAASAMLGHARLGRPSHGTTGTGTGLGLGAGGEDTLVDLPPMSPAPALGIDEEEVASIIRSTASRDVFNLWPWVNQVSCLYLHYSVWEFGVDDEMDT